MLRCPHDACRFGELAYRFPDGTIYGLANIQTGELDLNPSIDRVVSDWYTQGVLLMN